MLVNRNNPKLTENKTKILNNTQRDTYAHAGNK